ncbi:MAG TPA: RNA pseudouridine synthase [Caulifigura sp.]|jgi:23S rRNA pseudouridine1911/1915/1917 synthase|nr:RNA pseudouridine synthase [Caulifigura sp.]
MSAPIEVLVEDGPVLAVNKPPGLISQGAPVGVDSLISLVKDYLAEKYDKPGAVYLGVPHRLDRPVSGVVVFSRNSKCAARLAEQFQQRTVKKVYWACLERPPEPAEGVLKDWLYRVPDQPRVELSREGVEGAKHAELRYRTIAKAKGRAIVEIELLTGRMHQIRIQFGSRGWPIVGDHQYGAKSDFPGAAGLDARDAPIALHAHSLTIQHPIRYDPLTIVAPIPTSWRALGFDRSVLRKHAHDDGSEKRQS